MYDLELFRKLKRKLRPVALTLVLLASSYAAQDSSGKDMFTISVVKPTLAKDVQVNFVFYGPESTQNAVQQHTLYPTQLASLGSSTGWKLGDGNTIVMVTGPEAVPAKSFKLIAYAPGCQFVTLSVDDLASGNRWGQFECTRVNTIKFHGKANVSAFVEKRLQVQVLYNCDWAQAFFGERRRGAFSFIAPFSLGRADIASDGSFTISLPDFAADPLWLTVANDASLFFVLEDGANGQRLGTLRRSSDSSPKGSWLQVAPSYPEVDFNVQRY